MDIRKRGATILFLLMFCTGFCRLAGASYYLLVGSFSPEEAESMHQHLASQGYPVYLLYGENFEVRLGSFETREKADATAEKLKNEEKIVSQIQEEEDLDQYQVTYDTASPGIEVNQETVQTHTDPRVQKMLSSALDLFGHPYKYGGTRIGQGIDCSFFVQTIFNDMGIHLPRTSGEQFRVGRAVEKAELKTGDLLFFQKTYYAKRKGKKGKGVTRINHVGVYIGNGEFIHATLNAKRVTISRLDDEYFTKRFAGARRVIQE
jgi:cell wall-associated NlpC family hydrolase